MPVSRACRMSARPIESALRWSFPTNELFTFVQRIPCGLTENYFCVSSVNRSIALQLCICPSRRQALVRGFPRSWIRLPCKHILKNRTLRTSNSDNCCNKGNFDRKLIELDEQDGGRTVFISRLTSSQSRLCMTNKFSENRCGKSVCMYLLPARPRNIGK